MLPCGSIPTKFFRWRRTPRQKKAFRNASLQSKAAYPVGFLLPLQNASEARVLALTECVGADDSVGLKNVANSPQIFEKTLRSAADSVVRPYRLCSNLRKFHKITAYAIPAVMMAIL